MKRILYYMTILFVFLFSIGMIFFSSSCTTIKEFRKARTHTIEHHYHDSTYNYEKETIRELYNRPDSTKAFFDLDSFLKAGYGKSTDRYFKTEVRYINNGIEVTTTIDSLMERIRTLEKGFGSVKKNDQKEVESEIKEREKESTVNGIWLILLIIVITALYILWKRFY